MKNAFKVIAIIHFCSISLMFTSCNRSADCIWDDTRSAGRHMTRGIRTLGGKHGDSRQIRCRDEFFCEAIDVCPPDDEFIPLRDNPNSGELAVGEMMAPREIPGDPGSSLPGIEAFRDPNTNPNWASVFRTIHFAYNSSLVKGPENIKTVQNVAEYMRQNPRIYLFVEGHCDERGPEAYNLALGSHRANEVRNALLDAGVNPNNVFTISYGKEKPVVVGNDEDSWGQNRRADFKVLAR